MISLSRIKSQFFNRIYFYLKAKYASTFDGISVNYDQYRPSYPKALVDCIVESAHLRRTDHLLEIGCGTGKATGLFAEQGFPVTALEPGQNLMELAKVNLKNYSQVEFKIATFEDVEFQAERFDLIFSADAFHWVDQPVGYEKAHRLLKENGFIALFWNMHEYHEDAFHQDFMAIHRQYAASLSDKYQRYNAFDVGQFYRSELEDSHLFSNIQTTWFPWTRTYSAQEYLSLLETYSDYLVLNKRTKRRIFHDLSTVLNRYGDRVTKHYSTFLLMAQKKKMTGENR